MLISSEHNKSLFEWRHLKIRNVKLKIVFTSGAEKEVGFNTNYENTNEVIHEFLCSGSVYTENLWTSYWTDKHACGVIRLRDISMIEVVT